MYMHGFIPKPLCLRFHRGVADLDARDTAKTAWALARLRWNEPPLLTRLVSTAARVGGELEPQARQGETQRGFLVLKWVPSGNLT